MSGPNAWFAAASRIAECRSEHCAFKGALRDDGWRFEFGTPDARDLITWNGISDDHPITHIYTVEADQHAFELRFDPETPDWRMHVSGEIGGDGIVVELCTDSPNPTDAPHMLLSLRDGARIEGNSFTASGELVWDDATITITCDHGACELAGSEIIVIPASDGKERAGNQSMASRFSFFRVHLSVVG
jgi:hypothetical protein